MTPGYKQQPAPATAGGHANFRHVYAAGGSPRSLALWALVSGLLFASALALVLVLITFAAVAIWITAAVDGLCANGWSGNVVIAGAMGIGSVALALTGVRLLCRRQARPVLMVTLMLIIVLFLAAAGFSG